MLEQLPNAHCAANMDAQSANLLLLLLNTLFASQCALKDPNLYPPNSAPNLRDGDHFDFVVVGSGSAGSVVGSRLVESGKWKVLVLEAGGFPSIMTEIPGMFLTAELTDHQLWHYFSEPSKESCLGLRNGTSRWPRGKQLGGSSSINGMLYIRGNKNNFDSWAQAGNEGWDYDNVMKYYKRSEKLLAEDLQHLDSYGKEGLLPLTRYKVQDKVRDVLFESVKELGYEVLEEEGPIGFFESLQSLGDGVRANTAKTFLGSVKNSEKLALAYEAQVERVIIDKKEKKALGVQAKIGEKTMNIYADKEVILSAGAINSPHLLMLSGIGPQKHLEEMGVDVIQDLKVGNNLQDHLCLFFHMKISDDAVNQFIIEDEIYRYFAHRKGLLSTVGLLNIQGFINTRNNSKYPDIQFTYFAFLKNDTNLDAFGGVTNIHPDIFKNLKNHNQENNILTIVVILVQPKSRGQILLKSNDPIEKPILRSGYLTDEKNEDIETLLRGIRFVQTQLKTESFKKINPEPLDIGITNCKKFKFDTDDYWKCAIRNVGSTVFHTTSTCKMGPASDSSAVVDSRLKVHGVKNLRVVDASIMPNIVSGNTNAPTIMIGQKSAQMIIDDHSSIQVL